MKNFSMKSVTVATFPVLIGNVESPIYAAEFFTECFNEMLDRDSNYEDTYVMDIPNFQFERIEKR